MDKYHHNNKSDTQGQCSRKRWSRLLIYQVQAYCRSHGFFSLCLNFIEKKKTLNNSLNLLRFFFSFFLFFLSLITRTLTVIVSWTTGKNVDVFHSRPFGLNIFPVLSYLECQSSVVYFWMSHWILLEPDVLLDRTLDVIFLSLDHFIDVKHCFAPRYQASP